MKSLTFIFATVITTLLCAQIPQKISYQAVVRNSDGELITTQIGLKISILKGDDASTASAVYSELQTPTPNINGLISIKFGDETGWDDIDWASGTYFIKTEIDPTGGTDYTITGTSQLLSVPYAFHAQTAESIQNTYKHYIGELYGGGMVFYTYDEGNHGLIVSLNNLSDGISWGTSGVSVVDARSSYDGATNTQNIIIELGVSPATPASLCDDYSVGDYTDWYLPSIWELNLLYNQAFLITLKLENDEDALTSGISFFDPYWSSTERNPDDAWAQFCGYGFVGPDNHEKTNLYSVRAIRKF